MRGFERLSPTTGTPTWTFHVKTSWAIWQASAQGNALRSSAPFGAPVLARANTQVGPAWPEPTGLARAAYLD